MPEKTELAEFLNQLHHLEGFTEAREFTDKEKEEFGFNKADCCGILGTFGIDKPLPRMD